MTCDKWSKYTEKKKLISIALHIYIHWASINYWYNATKIVYAIADSQSMWNKENTIVTFL